MEGKQKGFLSCCVACSSFGFPNGLLRVLSYSLCFSPSLLDFCLFMQICCSIERSEGLGHECGPHRRPRYTTCYL